MGENDRIVICDTNILFDLLKGNLKVKTNLEKIGNENIAFTVITQAEAYCGSGKVQHQRF